MKDYGLFSSVSEKLVKRDSEELRKNGEQLKALQKESEWEKTLEGELFSLLGAMNMLGVMDGKTTDEAIRFRDNAVDKIMKYVRKHIAKSLSTREKEIAEKVKKIKTAGHDECNEDFLMNVLSILKH